MGNRILQIQQMEVIIVFLQSAEGSDGTRRVGRRQPDAAPLQGPVARRWLCSRRTGLREHGDSNLDCKRGAGDGNVASREFPAITNLCCSVVPVRVHSRVCLHTGEEGGWCLWKDL